MATFHTCLTFGSIRLLIFYLRASSISIFVLEASPQTAWILGTLILDQILSSIWYLSAQGRIDDLERKMPTRHDVKEQLCLSDNKI